MTRKPLSLHLLMIVLALMLSLPAWAVELTGQIRGVVSDTDGLAIPGIVVNLSSPQMQGTRSAEADANGGYRFLALPPGEYTVEAQGAGFHTARGTARVAAGLTARVDLTMQPDTAGEVLVVEEAAPVVDVTSVRSGTVMTKEMLRDIPNPGRDYQSAMNIAPGVTDNGTGNPNMRGGLSYGNQYFVDGVNTTDPVTNTFSMNMNFDAIEEIQVVTGGMDAEYGRAMGGAVNMVTRSGGNEFEGDAQILYQGTETQVYKPMPDELNDQGKLDKPERKDMTFAANLGGPIVKDRLWFFSGVQLNYSLYTPFLNQNLDRFEMQGDPAWDQQSRKWLSTYLFGKVTWKPSANQRIWIHAQADPTTIDNANASVSVLPSADIWWQQGGWLASMGHQWTPNAKTVVDTQLYTSDNYIKLRPMQWKDCKNYDERGVCTDQLDSSAADPLGVGASWVAQDADGYDYGPYAYAYYTKRPRSSLTFAVTRFEQFLGSHQFKLGVQADLVSSFSASPGLENGIEYWTHDGDPTNLEGYSPYLLYKNAEYTETRLKGTLVGWYIQDVWQPHPRLTIRPGARFEYSKFYNAQDVDVYSSFTVAPRLGVAYDLTGDGRTRAHAYYGRFYDPGFLEVASVLSKSSATEYYYWDDKSDDWSTTPAYSFASEFLVHDLLTPYSDEYDVGLSRDVGGGWEVAATGTFKRSQNLFEDDDVNLIWSADGGEIIGSRDGSGNSYFRLRTPNEAFVDYRSAEFTANKQFDEHWGMISSYTWSRSYGRYRDDTGEGLASGSFDIAELHDAEVGLMPYDVPHQLKLSGSYRDDTAWDLGEKTALGFLFGWNMEMSSGFPYGPLYQHDLYDWVYHEGLDGSYRLPGYSRVDMKGGLTLHQGRTKWDLTAECFNVFNNRTTTSVYANAYDTAGEPVTNSDGEILFGSLISRQRPRYFQLGLRGEF